MRALDDPGLRRAARLRAGAGLWLGVALLHLWLLGRWPLASTAPVPHQALAMLQSRLVWTLPVKAAAPVAAPAPGSTEPAPTTTPTHRRPPGATAVAAPIARATRTAAAAGGVEPATEAGSLSGPAPGLDLPGPTAAAPGVDMPGPTAVGPGVEAGADADAAAAAAAPIEPPPVYATRVPAPAELHYALRLGERSGQARLSWQHDGLQYRLRLQAEAQSLPLLLQSSSGGFDAAGLAPERFVDQRRGRGAARAANFQRDSGRISFSGSRAEYPAWPGAQDRLAWIVQLAAIAGAADPLPPQVSLFVVDARGIGDVWTFIDQGSVTLDTPLGAVSTRHLLRQPQRLFDWRVEAWLDAERGHWPVRLRMTLPRGGAVLELQRSAEPGPP